MKQDLYNLLDMDAILKKMKFYHPEYKYHIRRILDKHYDKIRPYIWKMSKSTSDGYTVFSLGDKVEIKISNGPSTERNMDIDIKVIDSRGTLNMYSYYGAELYDEACGRILYRQTKVEKDSLNVLGIDGGKERQELDERLKMACLLPDEDDIYFCTEKGFSKINNLDMKSYNTLLNYYNKDKLNIRSTTGIVSEFQSSAGLAVRKIAIEYGKCGNISDHPIDNLYFNIEDYNSIVSEKKLSKSIK